MIHIFLNELFILFLILFFQGECEADIQCPGGYYCFLDTGYCSPCTDCFVYNRNKVIWRSCAKGPIECGDCLPG